MVLATGPAAVFISSCMPLCFCGTKGTVLQARPYRAPEFALFACTSVCCRLRSGVFLGIAHCSLCVRACRSPGMPQRPRFAARCSPAQFQQLDKEAHDVAEKVAKHHQGRFRKEKMRHERGGMNPKTFTKYLHVIRLWFDFCLLLGIIHVRFAYAELGEDMWDVFIKHLYDCSSNNGTKPGVADGTLSSYCRMLVHVFQVRWEYAGFANCLAVTLNLLTLLICTADALSGRMQSLVSACPRACSVVLLGKYAVLAVQYTT